MGPAKSAVWKHFTKKLDKAECNLYTKEISCKGGNTTWLASHLRRSHNIETKSHPSVAGLMKKTSTYTTMTGMVSLSPPCVPDLSSNPIDGGSTTSPPLPSMVQQDIDVGVTTVTSTTKPKTQLPSIWDRARAGHLTAEKQNRINRKIAAYLVKDMKPFSTVESKSFRYMIKSIDDRVVLPNRVTVAERIISPWYKLESDILKTELRGVNHVSLTSDCWTSRSVIPYMTITVHFIDSSFTLKSKVLQTRILQDKHTGENISVALNSALEEWGLNEKVVAITTDNASNMGKAIKISDIDTQIGCLAHSLDLAAKKAVEVAKPITKKMKPVIAYLNRSAIGTQVFRETQEKLFPDKRYHKLINDVETRWNSTYLMYERYFEQRVAIHATFMDKRLADNNHVYRDFSNAEVKKAETFIATMKPFYDMTLAICSEKNPTGNMIPMLKDQIISKCSVEPTDDDFAKKLKGAIKANIEKRYNDPAVKLTLQKALCLHTRTKLKSCIENQAWESLAQEIVALREELTEVKIKQEDEVKEVLPPPEKPSLIDSVIYDDDDGDVELVQVTRKHLWIWQMMKY